jgi:ribosome biogenesis protein ERB1
LGNAGDKIIRDQFDRLLHLYLAPRAQRRKVDMDAEALLNRVLNIDDMRPFPSKVAMQVRTIGPINGIDISSDDGTIAVASNDDRVGLIDPKTGRVFSEVRIKMDQKSDEFILSVEYVRKSLLIVATNRRLVFLMYRQDANSFKEALDLVDFIRTNSENFKEEEQMLVADEDEDIEYQSTLKKNPKDAEKKEKFEKSYDKADFIFKTFSRKRKGVQVVLEIQFREFIRHCFIHKTRLFVSVVLQNKDGNRRLSILNLKQSTQTSLRVRTRNKIERSLFHPTKPLLFLITRTHIFLFDLKAQAVKKKLLSGCKVMTSAALHPNGDHLIVGSADRKLVWFDLDGGDKPFKKMRVHDQTMSAVAFHPNYKHFPLMVSTGHDCKAVLQFAKVDPQNLDDPMIAPLKNLRSHQRTDALGITAAAFFGLKHWLVTGGQDRFLKIWV